MQTERIAASEIARFIKGDDDASASLASMLRSKETNHLTVRALRFHNTAHVLQRASGRGLSFENIQNVVRYPTSKAKSRRGEHGGWVYNFQKTVDGITLKVVAEIKLDECWLITAYELS